MRDGGHGAQKHANECSILEDAREGSADRAVCVGGLSADNTLISTASRSPAIAHAVAELLPKALLSQQFWLWLTTKISPWFSPGTSP